MLMSQTRVMTSAEIDRILEDVAIDFMSESMDGRHVSLPLITIEFIHGNLPYSTHRYILTVHAGPGYEFESDTLEGVLTKVRDR